MSFLKQATQLGGVGAALNPSGAAHEVGGLLNISPLGLENFGKAMNGIATAGGATPGYGGDTGVNNHLQLLDPNTLAGVLARFNVPVSSDLQNPRRLAKMPGGFY